VRPFASWRADPLKRVVVPFDLGGSHHRCILRPPLRVGPTAREVATGISELRAAKVGEGHASLEVGFFHGGLPGDDLLDAARPWPVRLSASPADLEPVHLHHLQLQGLRTLELEVLSFDDGVLASADRGHDQAHVHALLREGQRLGLRMGAVLGPGIPRATPDVWASDLELLANSGFGFARINPIFALKNSTLALWYTQGRWIAPTLEQAVSMCTQAMDRLDSSPIEVVRLGLQPHHDIPVAAVAGPVHSDLRRLVETRRFGTRMRAGLVGGPTRGHVCFRVNPADLAWAKGESGTNLRILREAFPGLEPIIETDPTVPRGTVEVLFGGTRSTT
jgi:hypothetical protein